MHYNASHITSLKIWLVLNAMEQIKFITTSDLYYFTKTFYGGVK